MLCCLCCLVLWSVDIPCLAFVACCVLSSSLVVALSRFGVVCLFVAAYCF